MRFLVAFLVSTLLATAASAVTVSFDEIYLGPEGEAHLSFTGTDEDGDGWISNAEGSGDTISLAVLSATIYDAIFTCDYFFNCDSHDVTSTAVYDPSSTSFSPLSWFISVSTDMSVFQVGMINGPEYIFASQSTADAELVVDGRYQLTESLNIDIVVAPLPASVLLLLGSVLGLGLMRRVSAAA